MNYQELFWPALPEAMEAELFQFCLKVHDEMPTPANASDAIAPFQFIQFAQFDAPEYLKEWVRQNLNDINDEFVVQLQVWRNSDYGRRHIDIRREYSYNYLLMEHQGVTSWFEDDGAFIESVQYQHKKWYKHIGSAKYHDVVGVNNFRPAVTIYKRKQSEEITETRPLFWVKPQ